MRFKPEFIERISEANNIVELISQHTVLKPTGGGLMGRCPFPDHQEKTASFSVSEVKQVYHCFGCHKSGNIFSFLRDFQGLSFPEAVEFLADRAGIAVPRDEARSSQEAQMQDEWTQKKNQIREANHWASIYFHESLKKSAYDSVVTRYVEKRGLNKETIETFQIGYSPNSWDGLIEFLKSKKVPLTVAEEARLVKAKNQGPGYFDLFRDRLMFPIFNSQGHPVAFGGRILEQGEPKYLNSPEHMAFVKGKILYGLFQTARYIRSEDAVLIVEGYMDLVSLYQAGIKNVVATMGTALTAEHAKLIKRLTRNVIVLFDGDGAGQEAAERSLPILLNEGLYPKGLILENNLDPDDFVKKFGPEELQKKLQKAPDLFSLQLSEKMKNYRGEASQKIQLIDQLKSIFGSMQDTRLQDLYLSEAAQKLAVTPQWLKGSLGLGSGRPYQQGQGRQNSPNPSGAVSQVQGVEKKSANEESQEQGLPIYKLKGAQVAELRLMALALKSRANLEQILKENINEVLLHEGVREVLNKCALVYRQNPDHFDRLMSHFVTQVDEPRYLFHDDPLLKGMTQENGSPVLFDEEKEKKLIKDVIRRVRENSLRTQLKKIAEDMKLSPSPEKIEILVKLQKDLGSLKTQDEA